MDFSLCEFFPWRSVMKHAIRVVFAISFLLSGSATAQAAPTVQATLKADPSTFSGSCPAKITFNGAIMSSKAGRVQYKFI
nr:hypothetical protein [uncultured Desulfobulbus sp.]